MRRQKILLISLAVCIVLLTVGYFIFVKPLNKTEAEEESADTPETEDGEALGLSDRYFMFTSLEREDIESIKVDNAYGGFTMKSDSDGGFYIDGYKSLNLDSEKLSSLITVSTYTLSKTKVGSFLSDEKIAEYGLDNPQASWIVTDKKGNSYRVFVGDRLLTGGGYYCMFDGRKSVYVLGTELEDTILTSVEGYVTAVLSAGISQDDYYTVDNFTVFNGTTPLCRIRLVDEDKKQNKDALAENIMDYPTSYYPNTSLYYEIIYKLMSFTADKCVKIGATDADYEKYGLDNPAHTITFTYNNTDYQLFFSENVKGSYYAYSNLYPDVIGEVYEDSFPYLEKELIDYIDPYIFQQYLKDLECVNVSFGETDASFNITHIPAENEEKGESISVNANGRTLDEEKSENFRQYYKTLLAIIIKDYCKNDEYCKLSEEEIKALSRDYSAAYLTFSYKKLDGEGETYRFYRYSTRHSLVTIDGVGEFYVPTDLVNKLANDTEKILAGETVTAYEKN